MAVTRSWAAAAPAVISVRGPGKSAARQARGLYRQIPHFDKADDHLKDLTRIRKPGPKTPAQKTNAHRGRRWQ
jgi:hypothetical protein